MYDHLFAFTDEAEAQAALAPFGLYRPGTDEEPGSWDTSRTIVPISITMLDGTKPAGFWMAATTMERNTELEEIAQATLDPSPDAGARAVEYVISSVWPDENIDAIAEISPLWAGRPYRFPGLPAVPEAETAPQTDQ